MPQALNGKSLPLVLVRMSQGHKRGRRTGFPEFLFIRKRSAQAIGRRRKGGSPAGPRHQRMLTAWFTTADPNGFARLTSTMFSAPRPNLDMEFHLTKVSLAGIHYADSHKLHSVRRNSTRHEPSGNLSCLRCSPALYVIPLRHTTSH